MLEKAEVDLAVLGRLDEQSPHTKAFRDFVRAALAGHG
jgi:hypothetical protein